MAWADAWTAQHKPSEAVQSLRAQEAEHAQLVATSYGRLLDQLEVEFAAHAAALDLVNYTDRTTWPGHRSVQHMLLSANAKSFHTSIDLLRRGHYEDCLALTRGLYETFARALFISCYPDTTRSTLAPAPKGTRAFKLTNFLRDDLKLQWSSQYSIMSTFAHSRAFQVVQAWERTATRTGDPERFGVTHGFDPALFELAAPFLQFVLFAHLRFTTDQLVGGSDVSDPEALRTAHEARDLLSFGLETHPKPYWQQVRSDLDDVFAVVDTADQGGDWRTLIQDLRPPPPEET